MNMKFLSTEWKLACVLWQIDIEKVLLYKFVLICVHV